MTEKNKVVANLITMFDEEVAKQAFFLNDPEIIITFFREKGIDLRTLLIQSVYSYKRNITDDLAEIQVELIKMIDKVPEENRENFMNCIIIDSFLLHESRNYGNLGVCDELLKTINTNRTIDINSNSVQKTM